MDTLKNIDQNVVKIGQTQDLEFERLKNALKDVERKQQTLNSNIAILNNKLDTIIGLLEKNSR